MNIKFNDLSIVGKIWSIAEMFYIGIRDVKESYIRATFRKLEDLSFDEEIYNSNAVKEHSFECIIDSATKILEANSGAGGTKLIHDESLIATVWYDCISFNDIKNKLKNDSLTNQDIESLNQLFLELRRIWIGDLKAKNFSSKERRDLFKIKEEIEDLKLKIETRVKRNQINII